MLWIFISLLAAAFFAIVNTTDRFTLQKWIQNPVILLMAFGVTGMAMAMGIYAVHGFSYLSEANIWIAFLGGLFFILSSFFYLKAVKAEEVSRVVPLMSLNPLFVLALASVLLGEFFTPDRYLGMGLLIMGALMISAKSPRKIRFGKGAAFMILSTIAFAAGNVLTKYLLNFADYWTVFSYVRIGSFITIIPVLHFGFRDLLAVAKKSRKVAGVVFFNRVLGLTGLLLVALAASSGYISLVSALTATQTLFVLAIALVLSRFYPKILKEEFDRKTAAIKLVATTLMFIGVVLIV